MLKIYQKNISNISKKIQKYFDIFKKNSKNFKKIF